MIGERLANVRKGKKMKQDELAGILGLTKHSISMYENNKSTPSDEGYVKLAKALDISVDYLMGLIDEPYSYNREGSAMTILEDAPPEIKKVLYDFAEFLKTKYNKK